MSKTWKLIRYRGEWKQINTGNTQVSDLYNHVARNNSLELREEEH